MLKLIIVELDHIKLSSLGNKIVKRYELDDGISTAVKNIFIKNIIFQSEFGENLLYVFSKFRSDSNGTLNCRKDKIYDMLNAPEILPILYEIGLLNKNQNLVEINMEHIDLLSNMAKITQQQLESNLKFKKTIGNIGEEIVLNFEKERLRTDGCAYESDGVTRISKEFANAGYDIISFKRDNDGKIQKIYIEVKASTGNELDFYWSANEIKKSKVFGEYYWLYFVSEIDVQNRRSPNPPLMIQDPYQKIIIKKEYTSVPETYHVTRSRGQ